jgi:hypothetical protein
LTYKNATPKKTTVNSNIKASCIASLALPSGDQPVRVGWQCPLVSSGQHAREVDFFPAQHPFLLSPASSIEKVS